MSDGASAPTPAFWRIRWRLLLVAVALPAIGLFGLGLLMGSIHAAELADDLDERMLAQAAVEAESLFDGEELPHLHTPEGEDATELMEAISVRAIYRTDGTLYLHQPPEAAVPKRLVWKGPRGVEEPWIETAPASRPGVASDAATAATGPSATGAAERRVVLRVKDPLGGEWMLWLAAPLTPLEDAVSDFYRTSLAIAGGMVLLLGLLAWPLSRRVVRGVETLVTETLPHLSEPGRGTLARIRVRDEIDVLHNAIAEAAERLRLASEARGRVLAHAAHELRTPLSLMRTEIDLALRRERSADDLRSALGGLRAEVDRLGLLATGLLDLERLQFPTSFAPREVDLSVLCGEAVARFRAAEPAVELTVDVTPGLTAPVDDQMVRMAVDNLVGNAIKHSPPGGRVALVGARRGDHVRIEVEDDGPGVPESERARVFEPFYRSPGSPQGTGLGLAIVSQIAALHRGSIAVETGARGGARFVLELGLDTGSPPFSGSAG
ncbi:MAG: HAMP domain-containing sensor histidine kinase [Myxococcota bacterium]